jgi:outer membrane protein TolC
MKKVIIIIALFLSAVQVFSQQKLTIEQSLELAFKNSKDLKISNSKIISSSAKVDEVKSQFLPQLKLTANYTRLSDVPAFQVKLPISPVPITISDVILNNYSVKLSLQQPVFTGFRLNALRDAAEYYNEAANEEINKTKNEAAFSVYSAYLNLYKAKEVKSLLEESIKSIEKHIVDTKNYMDNGLATKNDLLKFEVQESNIKLSLIEANNNIDLTRSVLNKSLGLPLNEKTEIEKIEIVPEALKIDLDNLVKEAVDNRSEIKTVNYTLSANKENIRASRSGYFPSVFVSGNYTFSNPNQRYQPPLEEFKGTWDVGITLSWDIWNWGGTSSQVIQAEQNLYQSQTTLDLLKENIELEVNQNYLSLKYAKEKLDVIIKTIEQADENLRTFQEKYNVQLATSTDIIDAENSLLQAKTNYTNALIDYKLAKVRLEKSLGRKIY